MAFDLRAKSLCESSGRSIEKFFKFQIAQSYSQSASDIRCAAKSHSRVTSSIFAYPRRGLEGPQASSREREREKERTVEWRQAERIKTSRKQVRSDPPGKFKRTFYRVVITRIRVARTSSTTLPSSFPDPAWLPRRPEARPSFLEFMALNGARGHLLLTTRYLAVG